MCELSRKETLINKILARSARVCVVGLGYVGLSLAVEKAKVGFTVAGIEQNPDRVRRITAGQSYITDVDSGELGRLVRGGFISASEGYEAITTSDVIIICVPTPLTKNMVPDLRHIEEAARAIARKLRPGQMVSLESTTYPGTTEEVIRPILESSGLIIDQEIFLCHSPERIDPGNRDYKSNNTSKIVGAAGPASLAVAETFYRQAFAVLVPVSSTQTAELVKIFENTFRAVNIALVNELALLCDKMEINVWEVLKAAHTKPFGIMPFYPGPGVGGHCIPVDPYYLEWKARESNFTTRFISLSGEINRKMPEYVRDKAIRTLNQMGSVPSQSTVLIIGVAYKKDLSDCRESPAVQVAQLLLKEGVKVLYHDPYVPEIILGNDLYRSVPLTKELMQMSTLVLIATDHSELDYPWIVENASKILDTRNATRMVEDRAGKVVLL